VSTTEPDPATPVDPTELAEDRIVRSRTRRQVALDDEAIPRLPRGRGLRLAPGQLLKIGLTAGLLVMLIAVQRPCADSVSSFVVDFDRTGSARMPNPNTVQPPATVETGSAGDYEQLRPDMTEAEIKAAIERAKARANQPK
jgi:hypothetical protein